MRQPQKYLEQKMGYCFNNQKLITQALTHRSYSEQNNERFEFLGDAILGAVIAQELYNKFTYASEGELSRLRSSLVNADTLNIVAGEFEISKYILLGEGELRSGGLQRVSILADCVEAIIAAIYLDSDFETCKQIVLKWYNNKFNDPKIAEISKDAKTILQEWLQRRQYDLPVYTVISQTGNAYEQIFVVKCTLNKLNITTEGDAKSRRKAEQTAAARAMDLIVSKKIK
ncbi:MAG: ribonuclease III [Gammaproteobacteria bacterium]|nr:ribonuclease III [Gammaproteobacteria bacterium]